MEALHTYSPATLPTDERLPADYRVSAFHPFASENVAMHWDFFVGHYGNEELQRRDPAFREDIDGPPANGVLYPRAGTLGGRTVHNAMITVCKRVPPSLTMGPPGLE